MVAAVLTFIWRQALLGWGASPTTGMRESVVMLFRGLYHFAVAVAKGSAVDLIRYFAAPENQDLDLVKALRKKPPKLDCSPFPSILTRLALA